MQVASINQGLHGVRRGKTRAPAKATPCGNPMRQTPSRKPLLALALRRDHDDSFFNSSFVQEELFSWAQQGGIIQTIQDLFDWTDVHGKRTMLGYLEGASERVQVFYTRLRLSEDPQAQTYLRSLQATMLERQATWEGFFQSEQVFYAILRKMVNAEELLQRAGDATAVARVQQNQSAWIRGRYQEYVASQQPQGVLAPVTVQLYQ